MPELFLLPMPKSVTFEDGLFDFSSSALDCDCCDERVKREITQLYAQYHCNGVKNAAKIIVQHNFEEAESYTLQITSESLKISAPSAKGAFYAIQTLKQMLIKGTQLPCVTIKDEPDFPYRGFYHDITRGRLPKLETLKKLVDKAAYYKLNSLQLYVEQTFAFEEYDDILPQEERMTAEEVRELDAYCKERFIDLIPSLSCFGHLYTLLQSENYSDLCELENYVPTKHLWAERMSHHTIDASNPKSLQLIQSMIDRYLPLFSSKYFNICCDETFDLGCGRNLGKDKGELYVGFVSELIRYIESKGKTAMLWGDIALQHLDLLPEFSEKSVFLNWDYAQSPNKERVEIIANTKRTQILCPGTWGWARLLEYLPMSVDNIKNMAAYAKEYQALGILNTNWGDYGHLCSPQNAAYGMILGAAESWSVGACDTAYFEQSLGLLNYQNPNGEAIHCIHALNDCDRINAFMETYRYYDCLKKGEAFKPDNYSVDDLKQSALVCTGCAQTLQELCNNGQIEPETGTALLRAAQGLNCMFRALAVVCGAGPDDTLQQDFKTWLDRFSAEWETENKKDELYIVKDFFLEVLKHL